MESTAIPTDVVVDPDTTRRLQAEADRRGLAITPEALLAAATLDTWVAPLQHAMRAKELAYLDAVEPGTVFQWLENGGRTSPPS